MGTYVVFILFLIDVAYGEKLLQPPKKCLPTATIQGHCHLCVCHMDGIYHCQKKTCQEIEAPNPKLHECESNELYREGSTFCTCGHTGHWRSTNCRQKFHRLLLKKDPIKKNLRTNIPCKPNNLYITDCNICYCNANGVISFSSCTSRPCPKRFKGEFCTPGEVYRSANELCLCSYLNYYIDQLCLQVREEIVQPVDTNDLARIVDFRKSNSAIDVDYCEGNITLSIDCNTCICQENKFFCTVNECDTGRPALRSEGNSTGKSCSTEGITFLNTTIGNNREMLQLKKGERCIPGKFYKMSCNRCQCTKKYTLLCTKLACLNSVSNKQKLVENVGQKSNLRMSSPLALLPQGKCIPGRMYRKGCRKCFCDNTKKAMCSQNEKGACMKLVDGRPIPTTSPHDVRPPFTRMEMKTLQVLSSASQKCESGRSYKVNCNNCICTEKHNLLCTKELCLSFDDINRVEADERSGKKCSQPGSFATDVPCIECECVKGKTSCTRIMNCIAETRTKLSKGDIVNLKMQIDPVKDECVPGAVYTDNCNRCYCQPDSSLRCTQKTCLNYAQTKVLDYHFKQLAEEGL